MKPKNSEELQAVQRKECLIHDDAANPSSDEYAALLCRYEWLEAMINQVPDFIYAKDTDAKFVFANRAVVRNNGFSDVAEMVGLTDAQIHPQAIDEAQKIEAVERRVMKTGIADLGIEERYMKGEGWLMMSRVPLRDRDAKIIGVVGASRDITARKRTEELMSAKRTILRDVARGVELSCVVATIEKLLADVLANGAVKITLGSDFTKHLVTDGVVAIPILRRDGVSAGRLTARSAMTQESGIVEFLEGVAQTIGIAIDRDHDRNLIAFLAEHDALTGLANRHLLDRKLGVMLAEAAGPLAIAYLDLDNFKHVNDALGHTVGDQLLRIVSTRILASVGSDAIVARIGGDEFVMVLPLGQADAVARVKDMLVDLSRPISLDGMELRVTCSVGVAFSNEHGKTASELFTNADMAMYRAKRDGRNGIRVFAADFAETARSRLESVEELRQAIERDEFVLHFQPQQRISSERIVGAEALVRWLHPIRGLLMPGAFIPLAEEAGLITQIGDIVLRKACAQAIKWINDDLPPVRIAVNVSPRQFLEPSLTATISSILNEFGLSPAMLEIEVTESLIMEDVNGSITRMQELKSLGVSLAIDDFGTGYSSLSALKTFPLDRIKIDRSFIADSPGDAGSMAIVAAIINIAKALGLETIAEGVERQTQLDFIVGEGCDAFQGYHLARPLSASDFVAFMRGDSRSERSRRFI